MSKRYWLRYWEPSMMSDEILESLDFDPGHAVYSNDKFRGVDYNTERFVVVFHGEDLWYASKMVGICRIVDEEGIPDFHIWVDTAHQGAGIGAAILFETLNRLPRASYLSTVATPMGQKILHGMFGFDGSSGDTEKCWCETEGWLSGMKPAVKQYLGRICNELKTA